MMHVRYQPAEATAADAWIVAVEGSAVAVLSPEVSAATADAVWRGLGAGGIDAVLEALTGAFGTSLAALPEFAFALVEPSGVRVAVRGAIELIVEDADGVHSVSGSGVATWAERLLPGVHRLQVRATADAATLPIRSGVVAAAAVTVALAPPVPVAPAAVAAPASAAPVPPPVRAVREEIALQEDDEAGDVSSRTEISSRTAGAAAGSVAAADVAAPVDDFDLLWGATIVRPIAAAATLPLDVEGTSADPTPELVAVAPERPPAAREAAAQAPVHIGAGDDGIFGDHDGETMVVADARTMRTGGDHPEATDNPAARRPVRGRLVLSTGRVVALERPVVIGRRPKATRTSAAELPTLVAVDSPEQDISRSHIEIRADGDHALVTDLDTTNGTILLRGGHEPVRLHPNEPTMAVSGDVLDIGEGVSITFEVLS
ncbi:MAG: FHA domain-containing protein [Microbacterium sp.]